MVAVSVRSGVVCSRTGHGKASQGPWVWSSPQVWSDWGLNHIDSSEWPNPNLQLRFINPANHHWGRLFGDGASPLRGWTQIPTPSPCESNWASLGSLSRKTSSHHQSQPSPPVSVPTPPSVHRIPYHPSHPPPKSQNWSDYCFSTGSSNRFCFFLCICCRIPKHGRHTGAKATHTINW